MSLPIERVKDQLDIVSYIQTYVPSLKKAGRTYKACCPFHAEKTPSFVVNPETQQWRCYGSCATGGDLFSFAMKYNNWTFAEALQELAKMANVELKPQSPQQKQQQEADERLIGLLKTAAEMFHQNLFASTPEAKEALRYVKEKRGFSDDTIRDFQIGYAPGQWQWMHDSLVKIGYNEKDLLETGLISRNDAGNTYDRFRHRLMIPIRDDRGRVRGFGARALNPDDTPKYLNSPQSSLFDKSHTLFGLDRAKRSIQDMGYAVIVEGYMDAIQAHQAGYTNVVAQMGTALTEAQLKLLVPRNTQKIILALDADVAGQNATRRSLEVARQTLQTDFAGRLKADIRILHIDDAKDPDDVLRETPEKWADYVVQAKPVADFLIDMEMATLDINTATIQEKESVARRLLPLLNASEDNLYKRDNIQKLAMRLRIDERDLLGWAAQIQRDEAPPRPNKMQPPSSTPRPVRPMPLDDWDDTASSEEPPPYIPHDDDDLPHPPAEEGDYIPNYDRSIRATLPKVAPRAPIQRSPTGRYMQRAAEAYCLRMLLRQPEQLYFLNRKFSEMATQNGRLNSVLNELTSDDFSQTDYRLIFEMLRSAMNQDEVHPSEYLRFEIDHLLRDEVEQLLLSDDDWVKTHLRGRWQIDTQEVTTNMTRRPADPVPTFIQRTVEIRRDRLQREIQEIQFLIQEAQRTGDYQTAFQHVQAVSPRVQAIDIINTYFHQAAGKR